MTFEVTMQHMDTRVVSDETDNRPPKREYRHRILERGVHKIQAFPPAQMTTPSDERVSLARAFSATSSTDS